MSRSSLFAWYRTIPLGIVLILGIISFAFSFAPAALLRFVYPLHHEELIVASAREHGVDPCLVAAVIDTESGWDDDARSHRGAVGLMQVMPETAQDMVALGLVDGDAYDVDDLSDPAVNIEVGTAYLAYLIDYFSGSTDRAIAAYNAGLSNVNDWTLEDTVLHNAITFPETQAYLARVTSAWSRYRDLYTTKFEP